MKTTDLLQNALTAVLTICAVVVTGLLVRREFAGPAETARPAVRETVRHWQAYDDRGHRAGPVGAAVTIVEFSDFQCPFCRVAAGKLDSLRDEYPRDVAVVYRHFPMPQHRHAVAAAQASECAGAQGRFWQMHDALYARQDSIGMIDWTHFASDAGVGDLAAFETCLRDDDRAAIQSDTRAGRRLKVNGTPTLLINEHRVGCPAARHVARVRPGGTRRTFEVVTDPNENRQYHAAQDLPGLARARAFRDRLCPGPAVTPSGRRTAQ